MGLPTLKDMAWRDRICREAGPLERPGTGASGVRRPLSSASSAGAGRYRRNPISWHYGEPCSSPPSRSASNSRLQTAGSQCSSTTSYFTRSCSASRLQSAGASSMWSQSMRSTVLSVELEHERELREKAEKEVERLRAQLAEKEGQHKA